MSNPDAPRESLILSVKSAAIFGPKRGVFEKFANLKPCPLFSPTTVRPDAFISLCYGKSHGFA